MDWLAFTGQLLSKVPIERILFPEPDHSKRLAEFAQREGYLNKSIALLDRATELSDADIRARVRSIYELREWAGDDVERRERVLRISKEQEGV